MPVLQPSLTRLCTISVSQGYNPFGTDLYAPTGGTPSVADVSSFNGITAQASILDGLQSSVTVSGQTITLGNTGVLALTAGNGIVISAGQSPSISQTAEGLTSQALTSVGTITQAAVGTTITYSSPSIVFPGAGKYLLSVQTYVPYTLLTPTANTGMAVFYDNTALGTELAINQLVGNGNLTVGSQASPGLSATMAGFITIPPSASTSVIQVVVNNCIALASVTGVVMRYGFLKLS